MVEQFSMFHFDRRMFHFVVLLISRAVCADAERETSFLSDADVHCRDNDNRPVDWWYIYKPPMGAAPNLEMGRNFSFITPRTHARWETSDKYINSDSMLQRTLSPLFRPTYKDNLAVVAYTDNEGLLKSSAHGMMIANKVGGIWLGYTLPSLFSDDRPSFPNDKLESGHLITCLSLSLPALDSVAASLREIKPSVVRLKVPVNMRPFLPHWQYFNRPLKLKRGSQNRMLNFVTTASTLRGVVVVRRAGEKQCLYRTFAKAKGVVLDVYAHDGGRSQPVCDHEYGVRNIDSISMKYPGSVYYIDNRTDRMNFGVSTALHWQRQGNGNRQFWTCTSSVEREDSTGKGGIMVCVHDYNVWWNFDTLKVKEPNC